MTSGLTLDAACPDSDEQLSSRADGGQPREPEPLRETATVDPVEYGVRALADGRPVDALPFLRTAVLLDAADDTALLNLALAEAAAGDPERSAELIDGIARRRPDWDEPHLRRAEQLRRAGRLEAAEQAYRHALSLNPDRPEAMVALGVLRLAANRAGDARDVLLRCCRVAPFRTEAWDALGLALMQTSEPAEAWAAFNEAARLAPDRIDLWIRRAEAALAAEDADAELVRLESNTDRSGKDWPAPALSMAARGYLLGQMGRRTAALDSLDAAVALGIDAPAILALRATLLARAERLPEARDALTDVLARLSDTSATGGLRLDSDQIACELAIVLMRMHRPREALGVLQDQLVRGGRTVSILCNLATVHSLLGRQEDAVATAREAIALGPHLGHGWRALCNVLPYRAGVTGAELHAALAGCARHLSRPETASAPFNNDRKPDRKLRIGLLSGRLRTHPVGWLTLAGFEALDPCHFSIVCFGRDSPRDPLARRFRALSAAWHETDEIDDPQLAALIRAEAIDILIDLGGYGDAGRLPVCALRPAPVQIKWVGMQNHGTGMTEIDHIIADRWEIPPELEPLYTERPLRLPDGYVCYSPPTYAPRVAALPALSNGFITFGCLNNLSKMTPPAFAAWARILGAAPGSRLVLKTHQFSDPETAAEVAAIFAGHGIDPARLEMQGAAPHRQFLAEYNQIDLVLDPFPYSGGLTTCEALWMGVPTVTVPGEIFASRHSASHLSNVGLTDWIAPTVPDYVDLAITKARDIGALAKLRAGLRERVAASPLCDSARFGRGLGAALRGVWRDWCAGSSRVD